MVGVLLLAFGLVATVIGWRVVWRVRAFARRFSRPGEVGRAPVSLLRAVPWRLVPGIGEAVLVWNRRARLAKLLALPLLGIGPLLTALGVVVLVHEVRGYHASDVTPFAIGAGLTAAALVWRYRRSSRRSVDRDWVDRDQVDRDHVSAGQGRTW